MKKYVYKTITISEEEFRKDSKKWLRYKEDGVDGMCIKVIGDNGKDQCSLGSMGPLFAGEATWEELRDNPKDVLKFAQELQGIYIVDGKGETMFTLDPNYYCVDDLVC